MEANKIKNSIPLILGFSLLFVAFVTLKPNEIFHNISKIDVSQLLLTPFFFITYCLLYGFRWSKILDSFCVPPSSLTLTKIVLMGSAINSVFPGRVGDIARSHYLTQEEKIEFSKSFPTIILEKFLDVFVLASLSVGCFYFFYDKETPDIIESGFFFVALLLSVFFFFFFITVFRPSAIEKINAHISSLIFVILNFFRIGTADLWKENTRVALDTMSRTLGTLIRNPRNIVLPLILTILMWSALDLCFFLVVKSFYLSYPISKVSTVFFSSILLGFVIPLTPGGLGTVGIVLTTLFIIILDTPETLAFSVVLVSRIIMYWSVLFTGGILIIRSSNLKLVRTEGNKS